MTYADKSDAVNEQFERNLLTACSIMQKLKITKDRTIVLEYTYIRNAFFAIFQTLLTLKGHT